MRPTTSDDEVSIRREPFKDLHPAFWWAGVSVGGMVVGAFGPWARVLGISIGGLDGSNDGWIVLGAAVVATVMLLAYARYARRSPLLFSIAAGLAGVATAYYDRREVQDLTESLGQVGWGLNVSLVASASLVLASLVLLRAPAPSRAVLARPDEL